jgi:Mg/Co/Ni transporter MgtE
MIGDQSRGALAAELDVGLVHHYEDVGLLTTDPEASVAAVMVEDFVKFHPEDEAHEAAQAFERYDLVMAPVVDVAGRLIGRLTVDAVVDYIRESADADMLSMAGLKEEEDLFSSVWRAGKTAGCGWRSTCAPPSSRRA